VTHWEGVKLAPNHWPGRDKVIALAATLKLMFGDEYKITIKVRGQKEVTYSYVQLSEDKQRNDYKHFKRYYDKHMMRLLNGKR
jgi:hypothetical protein